MILRILVFVVGAASLGSEIAAARLLAPWFGASTIVWANTIATVLVALSVGYAIGGRLADRNPSLHQLCKIVLVASVLVAVVPYLAGPFLKLSINAFEQLSVGVFLGSLVGVMVLIAVPVLLLGMVSPYAVKLSLDGLGDAGRVTGRLYALGTVGSLVGTFAASLLLIPLVGSRRTFLLFALSLALACVLGLSGRAKAVAALTVASIFFLITLPPGALKTEAAGKVIWEAESEYQYARVIQADDGTRTLELNEGQAIHSLYRPGSYLTGGYWDDMLALALSSRHRDRVAILGSAAGTTARAIGHYSPHTHIDAVEIDDKVTAAGRKYFDFKAPRLDTHAADARPWLHASSGNFDAILVDAYRQPYIPFYLATTEFFRLTRDKLAPGGIVAINVGHPEGSDKLEKALSATLQSVYGDKFVWRDPVDRTNTMLIAGRPDLDAPGRVAPDLAELGATVKARLAPGLKGGPVYTDDRAPVEWLVDLSLAEVAH